MALRTIETSARRFTIAPEDAVPLTQRFWGVVQVHVVDDLTGMPPRTPVRAETGIRGFRSHAGAGGMVGLAARPADVFPKLAERSYTVSFSIHAEGFLSRDLEMTVPSTAQFPVRTVDAGAGPGDGAVTMGSVDGITPTETLLVGRPGRRERVVVQNVNAGTRVVSFTPALAMAHREGDPVIVEGLTPFNPGSILTQLTVALRREPVMVIGRTIRRNAGGVTPAAGAAVTLAGIWRELVPAAIEPPAASPDLVSLQPPLYADRSAATGQLRRREMTPVMGEDKDLLVGVDAGARRLSLSDHVNLSSGDVVLVDSDPAVQEYVTIDTITPVGAAEQPATVALTHPLAYAHRRGRRVRRMNPQPPGPNRAFSDDATTGDTCVFLNSLTGLSGVGVVEVHGGASAEYHRLGHFTAVSDGDGRFRLPLLSRVAKMEVQATEGPDSSGPVPFIPHYPVRENHLELELS